MAAGISSDMRDFVLLCSAKGSEGKGGDGKGGMNPGGEDGLPGLLPTAAELGLQMPEDRPNPRK